MFQKLFTLLSLCDATILKTRRKFVTPVRNTSPCSFRVISVRLFTVLPHQQLDSVKKDFASDAKNTLFSINVQRNSLAINEKVYLETRKKFLLIMMNTNT